MTILIQNVLNQIMRYPEKTPKNQTKSDKSKTGLKMNETRFYQKSARERQQMHTGLAKYDLRPILKNAKNSKMKNPRV